MSDTRAVPACPDCGEEMVKAKVQNEEGDWGYAWLCGCEVGADEIPSAP